MSPRTTLITLRVWDLDRAVAFCRDGLELPTDGVSGYEFERGAVDHFRLVGGAAGGR